jgi:hypothetical protein
MTTKSLRHCTNSSMNLRAEMEANYVIVHDVSSSISFEKYVLFAKTMFTYAIRLYKKKDYKRAYVDFKKFQKFVTEKLPAHEGYDNDWSERAKIWLAEAQESAVAFLDEISFQLDVIEDMKLHPDSRATLLIAMTQGQQEPDIYVPEWIGDEHVKSPQQKPAASTSQSHSLSSNHPMSHLNVSIPTSNEYSSRASMDVTGSYTGYVSATPLARRIQVVRTPSHAPTPSAAASASHHTDSSHNSSHHSSYESHPPSHQNNLHYAGGSGTGSGTGTPYRTSPYGDASFGAPGEYTQEPLYQQQQQQQQQQHQHHYHSSRRETHDSHSSLYTQHTQQQQQQQQQYQSRPEYIFPGILDEDMAILNYYRAYTTLVFAVTNHFCVSYFYIVSNIYF